MKPHSVCKAATSSVSRTATSSALIAALFASGCSGATLTPAPRVIEKADAPPSPPEGVLAARSQLSVTTTDAPVYERFFAGGFRSLRGFQFRGVGPYENTLNTGGSFAFLNTLEYPIPLVANERLRFVTFVDHGTVDRNVSLNNYRVSVGVGIRLQVPAFGPLPIALDFGFPVVKGADDQKQIFSFYVGWIGGQ